MTGKIFALLALCFLSALGPSAVEATPVTISNPIVSYSLFNVTPVSVYNVSNSSDSAFLNGDYNLVYYSPGNTSDTIYAWLFNHASSNKITSIVMRTLNASILTGVASTDKNESFVNSAADVTTSVSYTYSGTPLFASGPGCIAFVTNGLATTSYTYQVSVNIGLGASGKITTNLATTNTLASTYYRMHALWYEDGYFYVVYSGYSNSVRRLEESERELATSTYGIYVQAYSAVNTSSSLYTTPMLVVTFSNTYLTSYTNVVAGPSNTTNSSYIYVSYKDPATNTVIQVVANRTTGAVVTQVTLASDGNNYVYVAVGMIAANYSSGTVVAGENSGNGLPYTLSAYLNQSATALPIGLATPDNHFPDLVTGINYPGGYLLYAQFAGSGDSVYQLQTYMANGTATSNPETLGIFGGPSNYFVDVVGAIWYGYTIYGSDAYTHAGLLGRLAGSGAYTVIVSLFSSLAVIISLFFI